MGGRRPSVISTYVARLNATTTIDSVNEHWTKRKLAETDDIKLEQLIEKKSTLTENNYYSIRGTIKEIENNSFLLYDACDHCYKIATKTTTGMSCLNCTGVPVQVIPRYRLTMLIEDETGIARITLFGHVAETFISHPIEEFIKIRNQKIDDIIPYNKESHRFLFRLDWTVKNHENMVSIVAESVEKPSPTHSRSIQTRRQRSLIKGKINNVDKKVSKCVSSTSSSKSDHPTGNEAHNKTTEIEDDELLVDYTKRIKKNTASQKKRATANRTIPL